LILLSASPAQALIGFGIKGGINNSKILFSPSDAFSNQDYLRGAIVLVFFLLLTWAASACSQKFFIRGAVWILKC